MNKQKYYNNKYFLERDQLDVLIAEPIKLLMKDKKLKKVLDVGCGTGKLVEFLAKSGFEAFGCDPSSKAINIARAVNKKGCIKKSSASNLPYKDKAFDIVTAISVIEHLTRTETKIFLKETKRVLNDNGYIFLVTPNFSSPFRYILKEKWFAFSDPTHINYFTPKSIRLLLSGSGFNNISFRFKTAYNISLDRYLPKPLRNLPMPIKNNLYYLMFSSPLSTLRDSLWVSAQK